MTYYYPKLSKYDFGLFRLSGPGLANCMFIAAKTFVQAHEKGGRFISPTWLKFSIGPYLRKERDKRAYSSLFNNYGISGWHKIYLISRSYFKEKNIIVVDSIKGYFQPLYGKRDLVKSYIDRITRQTTIQQLNGIDLSETIAVHIRLGDYANIPKFHVGMDWFKSIIENLRRQNESLHFAIFSDGTDQEISELTSMPNVTRHFYGNAFADMLAISKCKLLVASDSTFSAWGAYLGGKPIVFSKRHFPPVYSVEENIPEYVLGNSTEIPEDIISHLQ